MRMTTMVPVPQRAEFIDALCAQVQVKLEAARKQLAEERELLDDPSETDRDAQALHRMNVGRTISGIESNIAELEALLPWINSLTCNPSNPISPGNVLVLEDRVGRRIMWFVHDLGGPREGLETTVSLDIMDGAKSELGVDEILVLSRTCPLFARMANKDIRIGLDFHFDVEGNDPEVYRLIAII